MGSRDRAGTRRGIRYVTAHRFEAAAGAPPQPPRSAPHLDSLTRPSQSRQSARPTPPELPKSRGHLSIRAGWKEPATRWIEAKCWRS